MHLQRRGPRGCISHVDVSADTEVWWMPTADGETVSGFTCSPQWPWMPAELEPRLRVEFPAKYTPPTQRDDDSF